MLYTITGLQIGMQVTIHCNCITEDDGIQETHFAVHGSTLLCMTVGKLENGVNIDTLIMDACSTNKPITSPANL